MEQNKDITQMLDLMVCPAFEVKNGIITNVNSAAAGHMITPGCPVAGLLVTGRQEYAAFDGGCLYLTLNIGDSPCGTSVTRVNDSDIFVLEQEADQAELQAMALAAQELRNPLSNIMMTADNLFPMAQAVPGSDTGELTARINRGLFQMHRIISNMSDAYRYSREPEAHMATREITAVFDEQFARHANLLQAIDIQLSYTGIPEKIYGLFDTEKLERAISNILANSAKYAQRGSTISARLTRQRSMLYLTVQDGGSGIPEPVLGSVYHRYQRQPGIEDGRHGIGLGMVLIRAAAAVHGGTVLIETAPDRGTRITMTLAIRQSSEPAVRSLAASIDYAGERDHGLIELSDILPAELYK